MEKFYALLSEEKSYDWNPDSENFARKSYKDRKVPLHVAASFGAPLEVVSKLIQEYPDGLTTLDQWKKIPLHYAVIFVHVDN